LVARVAREQRPLHRLRQVHEREHRPVQVRKMGGEEGALLVGEGLDRIVHRGPRHLTYASRCSSTHSSLAVCSSTGTALSSRMWISRPSMISVATWLSNQGPSPIMRQPIPGSRTPASRASVRANTSNSRDIPIRIWLRSVFSSGLRYGEQTACQTFVLMPVPRG